jgi:hypothetical protein
MPKGRGRGRRRAPYRGRGEAKKERPVAQAAVPTEGRVSAVKGPATTPVAARTRPPQSPGQRLIPPEEQFRTIRNDVKRVGIVTAAMILLLIILWRVL